MSPQRALGGSAASGGELPLARVCFTALVGAGVLPLLTSPEEFGVRWALDLVVTVTRLFPFKLRVFSSFAPAWQRGTDHMAHFSFYLRISCDTEAYNLSKS